MAFALTLLAAVTLSLTTRFWPPHGTLTGTWNGAWIPPFQLLFPLWVFALAAIIPHVADRIGIPALHAVARRLPRGGHGALAVARHTLESRSIDRTRSMWSRKSDLGALVMSVMIAAHLLTGFTLDSEVDRQAAALEFTALVVPSSSAGAAQADSIGVDTRAIDPGVLEILSSDPALTVVPYSRVTVGPIDGLSPTATVVVMEPDDLATVAPHGAGPLGLQDGVLLSPEPESASLAFPAPRRLLDVALPSGSATVLNSVWPGTLTIATRSWAEEAWGPLPVVGAVVTYANHDLSPSERFTYVAAAATRAGASAQPIPVLDDNAVAFRSSVDGFADIVNAGMSVMFALAVSAFTVALALRGVRAQRAPRATLAALGATPRALAVSVPVDAGALLALSAALGMPLGVATAIVGKVPGLFTPGAPIDVTFIARAITWNLAHVGWGPVGTYLAVTLLVSLAASTVYGVRQSRRTPVDELREATKAGVS